jgi:hypothetical protein
MEGIDEQKKVNVLEEKTIDDSDKSSNTLQFSEDSFLSIDDLGVSLKTVAELKQGEKLKIIDNRYFAIDDRYVYSLSRTVCREEIIAFLEIMYNNIFKHGYRILSEIRSKQNVDNNICILNGLIYKIAIFLHNYETMRSVYKTNSDAYCKLGNNRDRFFMFMSNFFREMTTYGT